MTAAAATVAAPGGRLARLCRACAVLGAIALLACAVVTVLDVLARKLLGRSLPGLIDLSQLLVMTGVYLCIPYTFERRANVEVDLLHERLPRAARATLSVVWALAASAFLGAVTWHATHAAAQVLEYGERSPVLGWPMALYWAPVLFGSAVAALVCLTQALRPGGDPAPSLPSSEPR